MCLSYLRHLLLTKVITSEITGCTRARMFRLRHTKLDTQRPHDVIILCGTGDPILVYGGRNVTLTTHIRLSAVFK
jgi:hypothetical protein